MPHPIATCPVCKETIWEGESVRMTQERKGKPILLWHPGCMKDDAGRRSP